MQEVPAEVQLQAPNICIICEERPDRNFGIRVVDTFREFAPPAITNINGRKYVCENCVNELGRILGLVPADAVRETKQRSVEIRGQLGEFKAEVLHAAEFLADKMKNFPELTEIDVSTVEEVKPGKDVEPGKKIEDRKPDKK